MTAASQMQRPPAGNWIFKIHIEAATETRDAAGQPRRTWRDFGLPMRCDIEYVSGGEYRRGRQIQAGVTALVTMPWVADVTTAMRVTILGAGTFNIVRVIDPMNSKQFLELECKA